MLDLGSFVIADDFSFIGESGQLTVHSDHLIDLDNIRYHRRHYSLLTAPPDKPKVEANLRKKFKKLPKKYLDRNAGSLVPW